MKAQRKRNEQRIQRDALIYAEEQEKSHQRIRELLYEKEKLREVLELLHQGNVTLTQEKEKIVRNLELLMQEKEKLVGNLELLHQENASLTRDKEKLLENLELIHKKNAVQKQNNLTVIKKLSVLEQENLTLKQENEQLNLENQKLRSHVCPLWLKETVDRSLEGLFHEFWSYMLESARLVSKVAICTAVVFKGKCTHSSLQTGLGTFGFYISHSEALNAIRQIVGAAEPDEHLHTKESDFRQCLEHYQPYLLREDVNGSLRCLALLFVLHDVERETLEQAFGKMEDLNAVELYKELKSHSQLLPRKKLDKVVNFLMRGAEHLSGLIALTRIFQEVPAWKPLSKLESTCKQKVLDLLSDNESLVRILNQVKGDIKMSEFQAIWKQYTNLEYDVMQFIEASSLKHMLETNQSQSVVRLSHYVTTEIMLKWYHDAGVIVEPGSPRPCADDDEFK